MLCAAASFAQHTLEYMLMNVVLDTNGDAYVQEFRQMHIAPYGTENYISFYNLPEGMELKNVSVQEDGEFYTYDKYWDMSRSRAEKTFHCGINYSDQGPELCWGLGKEGDHSYLVRYVITNLVRSYEESDGFNHSFYEAASPAANDAFVVIHALKRDSVQYKPEDIWNLPYFKITNLDEWVDLNIVSDENDATDGTVDAYDPTRQKGMNPWGKPVEDNDSPPQLFSLLQLRQMADSLGISLDSLATVLQENPRRFNRLLDNEKTVELQLDTLRHPAVKAWAFGYNGYLDFYPNGALRAMNDSLPMYSGESMIIMVEFEKGMFNPAMKGEVSKFETVKERAFFDSDYSLDDEEDGTDKRASFLGGDSDTPMWMNWLVNILAALFLGALIILPIWGVIHFIRRLFWGKQIDQKKWDKNMTKLLGVKVENLPYYRDPPAGGRLTFSQRILAGLRPTDGVGISHLIEAFMMRMLYKGSIQITTETTEDGKLRDVFLITKPEEINNAEAHEDHAKIMGLYHKSMQDVIDRKENGIHVKIDDENLENLLHKLLYLAAGEDHLLQPDELKAFIEANPLKIRPYAQAVNYLVNASINQKLLPKEESKQVYGFHKFLKDFTLVNEREMTEVSLWKEYLVFASLYGLGDQVRKGMKKIAPDIMQLDKITSMLLASGASAVMVGSLISTMQKSYRYAQMYKTADEIKIERAAARAAARAARTYRSSGGGGRSSYSGGGGHSGGGGSGVR